LEGLSGFFSDQSIDFILYKSGAYSTRQRSALYAYVRHFLHQKGWQVDKLELKPGYFRVIASRRLSSSLSRAST